MKHLIIIGLYVIVALILSFILYFITGIYARISFPFILANLLVDYIAYKIETKENKAKVLNK